MIELVLAAWLQAIAAPSPTPDTIGSKACAGCHRAIYDSYAGTGMARSSGRAGTGPFKESFTSNRFADPNLGARYEISAAEGAYKMTFAREATSARGDRLLEWFVGSGNVGRSYLFAQDGFLFQAPVSYFSSAAKWGLSPGYAGKPFMDIARPVETACLTCHASRLQPVAGTQNGYREEPFLEGGIGCERCHGPGSSHVSARTAAAPFQSGEIVNPAKLSPARRDSVCEQCHLTGAARVARAGRSAAAFRPGELLSDQLAVFVWNTASSGERAATDHAEQLSRSACKRVAREKLACIACHDAHSKPDPSERAALFKQKCMSCHQTKPCTATAEKRAARQDDCTSCHMPKGRSREGEHVAYTDHTIPKAPGNSPTPEGVRVLQSFWPGSATDRDLAIALAGVGVEKPELRRQALAMLEKVAPQAEQDARFLAQLAQYYDALGRSEQARALYERVLKLDPGNVAAAANIGVYWAQTGRMSEAISLWERTVAVNPGMTSIALNLAVAQFRTGHKEQAQKTLQRVLGFHPDLGPARKLLDEMTSK